MKKSTTSTAVVPAAIVKGAWQEVSAIFEGFCLTAGHFTLSAMMEADAVNLCGPRYGRAEGKTAHRWGTTRGKVGFHGGKVAVARPRVRAHDGGEFGPAELGDGRVRGLAGPMGSEPDADQRIDTQVRPGGSLAGRRHRRPERGRGDEVGGVPAVRRAVGGTHEGMDGGRLVQAGPAGHPNRRHPHQGRPDAAGRRRHRWGRQKKHPLGVIEGATENAAVAQALLDKLVGRFNPKICRLFIIDGAKALSKAIRNTFGRHTPIQRCQVHYADVRIMPTSGAEPAWMAAIAA